MKLLVLRHVPFEGPAAIADWAALRNHSIEHLFCASNPHYPSTDDFDLLVIMGGPMSVYDPLDWLKPEKAFIRRAIDAGKPVLGICLGAQLIADVLGADVRPNGQREIGWYPIERAAEADDSLATLVDALPESLTPFHWHGDTFDIPEAATHWYRSKGCTNQAFIYQQRVIGLQFHLEFNPQTVQRVAEACPDELASGGAYVDTLDNMLASPERFEQANQQMFDLLDALVAFY